MDIKPKRANKPKTEKVDPTKLVDDKRVAHPVRPLRPADESLNSVIGQSVIIKGSPKKVLEVVIQSE